MKDKTIILTLNIPEIERVSPDVCESNRNSATLIMKAKKQPNITMDTVTQTVWLSGALNNLGETANFCPGKHKMERRNAKNIPCIFVQGDNVLIKILSRNSSIKPILNIYCMFNATSNVL